MQGSGRDERKRIEELERENEALRRRISALPDEPTATRLDRLLGDRLVLANLPQFVSVLERDTRVVYLNRSIPGRPVEEMIGLLATEHLDGDHRTAFLATFERAWSEGKPAELEFETRSGYHWVSYFVPIVDAGTVAFMLVTTLDLTSSRRAEMALRESETRIRQALEASGMGTWTWRMEEDRVHWDSRLRAIFGVESSENPLTYERYIGFVVPEDRDRVAAAVQTALETGVYHDLEHRIVRPNGEQRHVLCKGFVLRGDDGSVLGLRGGVFDVTERHALEEELRQAHKMEAIGRLTAGIAHNFNNLLGVILPSVELARIGPAKDIGTRLDDIEHAATRAAEMVRDLMLFARGGVAALRRPEDAVALVRRTLGIARATFGPAIAIDLDVVGEIPPISANAGQIEQVLLNVCLNARDALDAAVTARPVITVRVERTSTTTVGIRVSDNGPGMDEATRLRVFEPFFTTKPGNRGTGLGLASAYAIAVDHGGRIDCESAPGAGTTIALELPIADGPAQVREAEPPSAPRASGRERILVVDDEPAIRKIVCAILADAGFLVVEATDGAHALAVLAESAERVDLVVVDRAMPRLGGEAFVAELRRRGSRLPAVMLSGHHATAVGADAVLAKPVTSRALLETVRSVLDRAARAREKAAS